MMVRATKRLFNGVLREPGDVFVPIPGSFDPAVMVEVSSGAAPDAPSDETPTSVRPFAPTPEQIKSEMERAGVEGIVQPVTPEAVAQGPQPPRRRRPVAAQD